DARRLHEASLRLIEEDDIQALYGHLLDAAVSVMGAQFGSIRVLDAERQQLKLLAACGFTPDAQAYFSVVEAPGGRSYGHALSAAVSVMGAACGRIQVLDAERQQLKRLASCGSTPEAQAYFRVVDAHGGSSCGAALAAGERVVIADMEASEVMAGTRAP